MGYLSNNTITVDAILTKKGREKLAQGSGFQITQFAVGDDEVDYTLWNTSHPLGTDYYGSAIENLPLVEASPDETQNLRYKLVTLPRGTKEIPIISVGFSSLTLTYSVSNATAIVPTTSQNFNGPGFGYTAILFDSDAATLVGSGLANNQATSAGFIGDAQSANAVVARGTQFTLSPKDVSAAISTTLTIIGNQTGATLTLSITVNPKPTV